MKYSYEFKLECVELYYQGKRPQTPKGLSWERFRHYIREWVRIYEAQGPEALRHSGTNKAWTPEEKLDLVSKTLGGESCYSVAIEAGINEGLLYSWVRRYKLEGYSGLVSKKKGRPPKEPSMTKKKEVQPAELTESEKEELIRLRAENEYLRTEIEVVKKRIALRHERWAAELKAKKQRYAKNSEKKDTD